MEIEPVYCLERGHIFGDKEKDPSRVAMAVCPHRDCVQPRELFFSRKSYRCLLPCAQEDSSQLPEVCAPISITTEQDLQPFLKEAEQQVEAIAQGFIAKNYPTVNEEQVEATASQLRQRLGQSGVTGMEIERLFFVSERFGMGRVENTATYLPNKLAVLRKLELHVPQRERLLNTSTELEILYAAGTHEAGEAHSLLYFPQCPGEEEQRQQAKAAYNEWLDRQFQLTELLDKMEIVRKRRVPIIPETE